MKLYIKQKVFTIRDKFTIKNEDQIDIFTAVGKLISLTKKLTVYDQGGQEVIFLDQRLWHFLPHIDVYVNQQREFTVIKKFTFFKQHYVIDGMSWHVEGDFWAHNYQVMDQTEILAKISKAFFSWGDFYEIDIVDENNAEKIIAIVLAIDIAMSSSKNNASSSGSNNR
jgi:uncharacterized protein YxjI